MSNIKLTDKGGGDYAPIPAGCHQAVCYGVVDIGTQPASNPQHKPSRKIALLFELPYERGDFGEKKNQPRAISTVMTASLNQKAILRGFLESWRGRKFTEEELRGFDPKVLIGVNCQLSVVHAQQGDKTYANIKSVIPLAKGMSKMPQENKSLYFSLPDPEEGGDLTNIQFPDNMPDWLRKKIAFCEEVEEANGGGEYQGPSPEEEEAARAAHEADTAAHAAGKSVEGYRPTVQRPPAQENLDADTPF